MGYSGSDDFDIGPMLKELPFLSRLIWIEHSFDDQITITKVNKKNNITNEDNLSRSERLLTEIRASGEYEVFLINAHTGKIIRNNLRKTLLSHLSVNDFELLETISDIPPFHEWVNPLYKDISLIEQYRLACNYFIF